MDLDGGGSPASQPWALGGPVESHVVQPRGIEAPYGAGTNKEDMYRPTGAVNGLNSIIEAPVIGCPDWFVSLPLWRRLPGRYRSHLTRRDRDSEWRAPRLRSGDQYR